MDASTTEAPRQLYRVFLPKHARFQLARLASEVRMHLETHLENVAVLAGNTPFEELERLLPRQDHYFVAEVAGARVLFSIDRLMHALFVHRIERVNADSHPSATQGRHRTH